MLPTDHVAHAHDKMVDREMACCVFVLAPMNLACCEDFTHHLVFIGGEP